MGAVWNVETSACRQQSRIFWTSLQPAYIGLSLEMRCICCLESPEAYVVSCGHNVMLEHAIIIREAFLHLESLTRV